MIYRIEPLSFIRPELDALARMSFEETWSNQDGGFAPFWDFYQDLEEKNELRFMAARSEGVLVGFAALRIGRCNCTSNITGAIQDVYVMPPYRGKAGRALLANCEQLLFELGCKSVTISERHVARRAGPLYQRMGYKPVETLWQKPLGGFHG